MGPEHLSDDDPMPFGEHRGKPMQAVPSEYLDYIAGQAWISKWPAVEDYIRRSRKAIDQDLKRQGRI